MKWITEWINSTVGKKGSTLDTYYSEDDLLEKEKLNVELAYMKRKYTLLEKDNFTLLKSIEQIEKDIDNVASELSLYKAKEEAASESKKLEDSMNNKYPKKDIVYQRKEIDGIYEIDVRNFFQINDFSIPVVAGETNDDKALNALKWVHNNISYSSDLNVYGISEYWAYSYQVVKHRKDDCDGGAVLLANIMLKSGIPYWRIRLNAGDVKDPFSNNQVGHLYVTYCRETDNEFVVLDWCYYYKSIPVSQRKKHSEERDYFGIWFSWNRDYSFGKIQTMKGSEEKGFKVAKWQA